LWQKTVHASRVIPRAEVARRIAFARRLDLDHFGAVVGEREREIGTGKEKGEVEDPQTFELHRRFNR
jgi:hypothetical protein